MGAKRRGAGEEVMSRRTTERSPSEAVPKRQRVSRACDQCRAAREKCDGIRPLCFPCASQNRLCTWEEPKKKRGVQTGYIRTLEMALGWIFDKIPESENSLHGLLTHEGGQGRLLLAGKDTSAGNRLHRRWRRSTVHTEIERVLSGDATPTKSTNASTPGEESDEDRPEEDSLARRGEMSVSNISEPTEHLKDERNTPDIAHPRAQRPRDLTTSQMNGTDLVKSPPNLQSPTQLQRPPIVKLPSNHWRLLDIYFSYTHIWFPILEKHELLKTGYSYLNGELHITRDTPGSAGHAELWAALALASYQELASRASGSVEEVLADPLYMKPRDIYHIAHNLIPIESGSFESRHINALLLLTLVNMACDNLRSAWVSIGMACRIALSLRLHENLVSARHKQSPHTYMGCFILETLLSARLGLVPHLRPDMAHLNLPRLDNDLDEWQPWMPCSDFGPSKRDAPPSRMPSHSISSFGILHMIHVVLSHRLWDAPEHSSQSGDVFLRALQNAVTHCGAQASLSNCVLTGEALTGQLPSVHLLRVAFLCAASMHKGFAHLHRAVLICIESYMNNFGLCGLPPLLAVFMQIIGQRVQGNSLTGEERDRWKQIEMTIGSVWVEPIRNCDPGTRVEGIHSTHYSRPSDTTFGPIPDMRSQQPSTATPFHPITEITHGSTNISIPFSHDPNSKMSELGAHQPHPETARLHLNAPSSTIGDFEDINTLAISPSMHFSGSRRPDFTGAALDHDTILDDIASFERTSVPESDTQFMANLGLRPGTNLADVFSLEFMGFP